MYGGKTRPARNREQISEWVCAHTPYRLNCLSHELISAKVLRVFLIKVTTTLLFRGLRPWRDKSSQYP